MKNWDVYWTTHNFDSLRTNEKLKKYFKEDEEVKTENSNDSYWKPRAGIYYDPTKNGDKRAGGGS